MLTGYLLYHISFSEAQLSEIVDNVVQLLMYLLLWYQGLVVVSIAERAMLKFLILKISCFGNCKFLSAIFFYFMCVEILFYPCVLIIAISSWWIAHLSVWKVSVLKYLALKSTISYFSTIISIFLCFLFVCILLCLLSIFCLYISNIYLLDST